MSKTTKIAKNQPLGGQVIDFGIILGGLLPLIFAAFARHAEAAYFATSIERQLGSRRSRLPVLPSTFHKQIVAFCDAIVDTTFLHFMLIFCAKVRFLDLLRDPLGPKMAPAIAQWRQNGIPTVSPELPKCSPEADCCPRVRPKRPKTHFG